MADAAYGAYGPFEQLNTETKDIFAQAMHGHVGEGYTPLLVATQIVSGANYIYICNVVVHNAPPFPAEVIIFKPLKGPPHVVSIKRFS